MSYFISCPECEGKNLEILGEKWAENEELYSVTIYKCLDCNDEFDEEEGNELKRDDSWV